MTGVAHVLKPGGLFVSMTFNQPHFRRPLLQATGALHVKLQHKKELGFKECFVFHMTHPVCPVQAPLE